MLTDRQMLSAVFPNRHNNSVNAAWVTVTQVDPPQVQFEGTPYLIRPDNLLCSLAVGMRLWCIVVDRVVTVLNPAGGSGSTDMSAYMTADQVKSYVASALVGELTQEQVEQIVAQVLASSDVDHATMTQVNEAISAATSGLVTSAQLSTATAGLITQDDLAAHQSDDLAMWQQVMDSASAQFAELKAGLAAVQASLQNKVLDTAGKVDIETEAQGVGYTVDATLGGQVTFTSPLALLAGVGTVWVNNVKVWTNVGLTLGVGLTSDTIEVVSGDVVATAGCTSVYFTPYKAA